MFEKVYFYVFLKVLYCDYGIWCYGFYGISYKFILDSMVVLLDKLVV